MAKPVITRAAASPQSAARRGARKRTDRIFQLLFLVAIGIALASLAMLLYDVFSSGAKHLRWEFLTNTPSRFFNQAGIKVALIGSFYMIALTSALALPVGVATAIYLEFYTTKNWFNRVLQLNIANLAGVPSIIYGLFGFAIFVRYLSLDRSILSAALTMALLILPVIIVSAQEALKAVPPSLSHAAYALGASKWQVVSTVVLPAAIGGILTGAILSLSRALGETAPLISIAWAFIVHVPKSPMDGFTVLPMQIYNWASRPQQGFQEIAATAIIVLLIVLLSLNSVAIILRNKYQKKAEW